MLKRQFLSSSSFSFFSFWSFCSFQGSAILVSSDLPPGQVFLSFGNVDVYINVRNGARRAPTLHSPEGVSCPPSLQAERRPPCRFFRAARATDDGERGRASGGPSVLMSRCLPGGGSVRRRAFKGLLHTNGHRLLLRVEKSKWTPSPSRSLSRV